MTKQKIQELLQQQITLFDGAFGTYYAAKYDTKELPELSNLCYPGRVEEIHKEYIDAGARIIRTNTYAANTVSLQEDAKDVQTYLRIGYEIATDAAKQANEQVLVAADIGPIPCDNPADREAVVQEYIDICKTFLDAGASFFVFETFSDIEDIRPAIEMVGKQAFVVVQFAVNQFGYSAAGLSAKRLMKKAEGMDCIDAAGFNCGVGPGHMQQIIKGANPLGSKLLTALPNAGYPQMVSNRMIFSKQNKKYFAQKVCDIAMDGANMVGGCCGTTPEYIAILKKCLDEKLSVYKKSVKTEKNADGDSCQKKVSPTLNAFFEGKQGKKLIAVELAPPFGTDVEKLMDAAHLLKKSDVDVLTFPDSPSGRTRADSIMMAKKVAEETGMCVMPHICCRDKNAIAMRSQLLGASVNDIKNFLIITGDPIPMMARSSVKSVFNFNSVGLMQIVSEMNEEQFADSPLCFGGAINQTCRNLDVEIKKVKRKMEAGATFFLTQPVSTQEGAERLRRVKEEWN